MNEEKAFIESYVANALPQGRVTELRLFDKNYPNENKFDA